ncbi:IS3 family transposase [Paenibacillus sp. WLX1005]|uniref:IS3 family transposase n=1 Tax=Paenibacillus sp. WLX1005 TaxID=3243766 RepID=UPI0039842C11
MPYAKVVFLHLKTEKLNLNNPKTMEEARHHIAEYLNHYNEERFESKRNDLSPKEFREKVIS